MFGDKYANDKKYHKVTYHYHYVGKYGGALHRICYLKYTYLKWINLRLLFYHKKASRKI